MNIKEATAIIETIYQKEVLGIQFVEGSRTSFTATISGVQGVQTLHLGNIQPR